MIREMTSVPLKRSIFAVIALLSPSALFAQGCAMCYQTAAGSGGQFIQALRHGILIMLFPPILIMAAIYYAAYRKRNQFNTSTGVAATEDSHGGDVPPEWTLADESYLRSLV